MSNTSPHAEKRLADDVVGWLTTVSESGKPSTAPVWFLYEADSILLYSRDPSLRVDNVAANDRVTFALNSDRLGHDVVVVNARAAIEPDAPGADENAAYLEKYEAHMAKNGWSPEWFADRYPAAIRLDITSVTGR